MQKVIQIFFGLFLFSFPFGYRWLIYEQAAYRFGHFNPFVSGFIYLPEVLLIATFLLWWWQMRSSWKIKGAFPVLIALFLLNAFGVTWWRGDLVLVGLFLLRMAEMGMFYTLITARVLPIKKMIVWLSSGVAFQVVLALLQWKFNHSLGLSLLGESVIGPDILNVAKIDSAENGKQIRGYGTFLHPNILAGYVLVLFFCVWPFLKRQGRLFWLLLLFVGLYFARSEAAILVALISLVFLLFKPAFRQRFYGVVFLFLIVGNVWLLFNSFALQATDPSITQRLTQNQISQQMFTAHPLGVGVGNFTLEMPEHHAYKLAPWELQPVHNTYFLILNELGVQGLMLLLILVGLFWFQFLSSPALPAFAALLLLAPFDHFLWTSWMGMMLAAFALAFCSLAPDTT